MDTDSLARDGGPDKNSKYDQMRHESMRLRDNGSYGKLKIFIDGFKPSPWCECGCGMRKVWCESNK